MKLTFISETATGRLHQRANALTAELQGTRVMFWCSDTMSGPMQSSPAGRQIHKLMKAMLGMPYVSGSDFQPLRDTTDLEAVATAIMAEGAELNSYPHPTGPQTTSVVIVADALVLRQLAEHFGATVDPTQLFTVVDVELATW